MARKKSKLPKWAIKQAGGINKKAWRLARRGRKSGTKKGQVRKTARRAYTRRNNPRRTMSRRKKNFNIPLVKTVAGLALFSIAKGGQTSQTVLSDPLGALQTSGANLVAGKDLAVKVAAASLAAQFLSSDVLRKKEIGAIGPIKIKV